MEIVSSLASVNTELWSVEDALRIHEKVGNFDVGFVALARSVYHLNDQRATLKRSINELLDSNLQEVKILPSYSENN